MIPVYRWFPCKASAFCARRICLRCQGRSGERASLSIVREEGHHFQAFSDQAALGHQKRLLRGVCVARASSIFLAMLDCLREFERYVQRMSAALEKPLTFA